MPCGKHTIPALGIERWQEGYHRASALDASAATAPPLPRAPVIHSDQAEEIRDPLTQPSRRLEAQKKTRDPKPPTLGPSHAQDLLPLDPLLGPQPALRALERRLVESSPATDPPRLRPPPPRPKASPEPTAPGCRARDRAGTP